METTAARTPSRRTMLTLGAGAALAAAFSAGGGTAFASTPGADAIARRFGELERRYSARLGVFARNLRTGRTVRHNADDLFPMCSTFKTLAVAAVLRDLDRDGEFLAKRVHYTKEYAEKSGYDKITGRPENVANGMTIEELCAAAISFSDNAAANLLLTELGGPSAVTRLCRSLGDRVTRLDRWEPDLNTAEPGRLTDTTTPRAIGQTYARLVVGNALDRGDRERLKGWLLANTTSDERFRKNLPAGWTVGDKTGTGSYGTGNDVGIAWTPDGSPVVLSVLTTTTTGNAKAAASDALIAETAALLRAKLG
ncbi:class A beta-lactamase [Streptomyces sp. NPDC049577]|uniref:class A beta-lactamase n=1 Tax=Streptomyces sp. NPDC049577 TaxID=3155153 RepID=UPI00341917BA